MYLIYPRFLSILARYLTNRGRYPSDVVLLTPIGRITVTLHSYHDLLTLNEVFAREDYRADSGLACVVDLGSNIGISALYFLTRNRTARVYCFEPLPANCERLRMNIAPYVNRVVLHEAAVATQAGTFEFAVEPTGRYGGLRDGFGYGREVTNVTNVPCLDVNDVLDKILSREESIDLLKIDTEGPEVATVQAIRPDLLPRLGRIDIEARPAFQLRPTELVQVQDGSICRLTPVNRSVG